MFNYKPFYLIPHRYQTITRPRPDRDQSENNPKLQLSQELENDENQNENNIDARDVKFTIKSNETNYQMNVRTGMANYKCKFLGKQEVDGKVRFRVFNQNFIWKKVMFDFS